MICCWKVGVKNGVIEDAAYAKAIVDRIPECTLEHLSAVWVSEELTGVALTDRLNTADELVTVEDESLLMDKLTAQIGNAQYLQEAESIRRGRRRSYWVMRSSNEPERGYIMEFKQPVYAVTNDLASTWDWGMDTAKRQEIEHKIRELTDRAKAAGEVYLTDRICRPMPDGFIQKNVGLRFVQLYYNPGRARALAKTRAKREARGRELAGLCTIVPKVIENMYLVFKYTRGLHSLYKQQYEQTGADVKDLRLDSLDHVRDFEWLARRVGRARKFRKVLKRSLLQLRPLIPELQKWFGDLKYEHLVGDAKRIRLYLLTSYRRYYPGRCRKEIAMLRSAVIQVKGKQ